MAFFDSFTGSLKQKWLQFFQMNRDWIKLHMEIESVYTPDGGKRPPSYLILGVANALEPKLAQLMLPFSRLNPDADTLVEVLDLNFDPDLALGNRTAIPAETAPQSYAAPAALVQEPQDDTFTDASIDHPVAVVHTYEETVVITDADTAAELSEMSLEDMGSAEVEIPDTLVDFALDSDPTAPDQSFVDLSSDADALDELTFATDASSDESIETLNISDDEGLGDLSFDAFNDTASQSSGTYTTGASDNEVLELNTSDDDAFSDVLSDVWGEGTPSQSSEENDDLILDDDLLSDGDDSEISRLFPNT